MKKGLSRESIGRIAAFTVKHAVVNDQLPGGYGDDVLPSEHCLRQVFKGIQVEMEHTDDPSVALEIALDHLAEFPDYYTRLEGMEDEATEFHDEESGPSEVREMEELEAGMQEEMHDIPSRGRHPRG